MTGHVIGNQTYGLALDLRKSGNRVDPSSRFPGSLSASVRFQEIDQIPQFGES